MKTLSQSGVGGATASPTSHKAVSLATWIFRLAALALIDAVAIWLLYQMLQDGYWQLALAISLVTVLINMVFLREELYPLRWISPGLGLLIVMVMYPILFTFYTAFTNYGDGHLLSKPLVIQQLEQQRFLAEDAQLFDYVAYISPDGTDYTLYLVSPDQTEAYIARPDELTPVEPGEPPAEINGYRQLTRADLLRGGHTARLLNFTFGDEETAFRVSDRQLGRAAEFQQRYTYLPEEDAVLDNQTGTLYHAQMGTFTAGDGARLRPGFQVFIGTDNFERLLTNRAFLQPFIYVFLWTVAFAVLSVLTTFALGLFLAIMFDVPNMPLQRPLRSLLLIPYAIPAFISVPIWVGLINPQFGVVSLFLRDLGIIIPWFGHPHWAKAGIILINLWLGFPYMFLICTGALQALPSDIYEAADIDGASPWQKFRTLTLPLLLITVGPLLVASFAFNFNNFVIIDLYNEGRPPMAGTPSPVGHTDILVTYTYRIAFASARGADLGYAAAITVAIFLILVVITYFQFRYTNMLEERSENV
jgi:arabinogalactan oligomer / maltooligosaccharide transport system permease protein